MDRPFDDHRSKLAQRTRASVSRIYGRAPNAKARHRRDALHARESRDGPAFDARRSQKPASRRSRRLHEAHLFLAGRAATPEVHRNLERGKERAVSSSPANGHLATSASRGASGTLLAVRGIAKRFGEKEVLKSLSLDIAAGEFITLLGESGSGKTTLLRIIAGFEQPTSGEIWMSGDRLDIQPAYKRRVNTVFQQYALFPHLSVRDNVAYGLRVKNTPKLEIGGRVDQALQMVKMGE